MPDISSAVVFPPALLDLIDKKTSNPNFNHSSWNDDDLLPVRSHIRKYYRTAQRGKCVYCKRLISSASASNCHVEHILPKSLYKDFIFEPKNLCAVCAQCNSVKRAQEMSHGCLDTLDKKAAQKYPRSEKSFKIIHPHYDEYDEHIRIHQNKFYFPFSQKGYFTVMACDLNAHIREFGWSREFVDEGKVRAAAKRLISSKNSNEANIAISDLKDLLLDA